MTKVAVAGNLICDHIKTIESFPERGMCAPVLAFESAVGGAVCNTGIDLKVLFPSFEVEAVGIIGDDYDGAFMKDTLLKYGVGIDGIKVKKGISSCSDVMTERESGFRTFFSYKGVGTTLTEEDVLPVDCDIFHVGYLLFLDELDKEDTEYGTKMARLLKKLKDRGIMTSIDVLSEEGDRYAKVVLPALKYVDLAIMNETESGRIVGIEPRDKKGVISISALEEICKRLAAVGVSKKVVIHAPEIGVCYDVESKQFTAVPSINHPKGFIKGTVGAGDAFCAGFIGSFARGESDERALKVASLAATANLSAKDSISGMESLDKVERYESFGRKELPSVR